MKRNVCAVLLFGLASVVAWRPFVHNINSMHCAKTSEILNFFNCTWKKGPAGRSQDLLSFNFEVAQDIVQPSIKVILTIMRRKFPDFMLLNTSNIDACQFLNKKEGNHMLKVVRLTLEKYIPDIRKICPLLAGAVLHIKDFSLNTDDFPSYVPELNYRINVLMFENISQVFHINITGSIEQKKPKRN